MSASFPFQLFAVTAQGAQPLPVPPEAQTVHDLFHGLPLGVYSALRTFDHDKFLDLPGHLDRTDRSMALLGWEFRLDRPMFCHALHTVCTAWPGEEARVRFDVLAAPISVPGGESRVLIALAPFEPPTPQHYAEGVAVDLAPTLHREQPLVKSAEFVVTRQEHAPASAAYEQIIVNPAGELLEGSSSNFWAAHGGILQTAGEGVLAGITRTLVLQVAREEGIPVALQPLHSSLLPAISEAFITSASRGVLPVTRIAGQPVGDGHPGPVTRRLMETYTTRIRDLVRPATPL
jgi:branched-chain amino acid aminotransferase